MKWKSACCLLLVPDARSEIARSLAPRSLVRSATVLKPLFCFLGGGSMSSIPSVNRIWMHAVLSYQHHFQPPAQAKHSQGWPTPPQKKAPEGRRSRPWSDCAASAIVDDPPTPAAQQISMAAPAVPAPPAAPVLPPTAFLIALKNNVNVSSACVAGAPH